jgi:hypothetical protein
VSVPPWLALSLTVSLALAFSYQLLSRRLGWRVVGYWVLISLGFLMAEAVAESLGWDATRYGDLRLLPDLAGASAVIGLLWFLGL